MELSEVGDSLRAFLDAKTQAREEGLASSRSAIRSCGNAIRAMHRYEMDAAADLLKDAQSHLDSAHEALAGHDDMRHAGFVHDAEKEVAEARITFALVTDAALPGPDELGLSPSAYLKGMAESIGELRRHILDLMRHGHLDRCERLLGAMDDMYYLLVSMDYPDGITYGLRRLTDVARSIIERTRGDFTTAAIQSGLRDALTEHGSKLQS
ncbi:MAG: translin [Actinomycetota bacterium]|jgi:translin|nr:translin [Actinomycetota bacterium]MEA2487983.1 translin [Actinomycetota bacterium]